MASRRLAELLASHVFDADGRCLGQVHDVRLVQDGPFVEGFGSALRIDALIVGRGSFAVRLGFQRHQVKGPWLLKKIFCALESRARSVSWSLVEIWDGERVELRCRSDAVARLDDVY